MNDSRTAFLFLTLVAVVLSLLGTHPAYFPHLSSDVHVFFERAQFFVEHLSLGELSQNEYQPGAILYFIFLSPTLLIRNTFGWFNLTFVAANIVLIFLLARIYVAYQCEENIYLYSLLLLFAGPIVLFRFELLVAVLVCLAFLLWKNGLHLQSAFTLGVATLVKVYPVIFLPYLLLLAWKNEGVRRSLAVLAAFAFGLGALLAVYVLVFRARYVDIVSSLQFHAFKPIGLESVWATLFMLKALVRTGTLPEAQAGNGIWGISDSAVLGPSYLYNYIWLLPCGALHLWFYQLIKRTTPLVFDIRLCLLNMLLFLVFQKVIAPQYILWFVFLIPLLNISGMTDRRGWAENVILVELICFLYQFLYPLNYSLWIEGLQKHRHITLLLTINSVRNILLVVVCLRVFLDLKDTLRQARHGPDLELSSSG